MATERIQKLAELLKQKDLLKQQDRELQNLRRKALANKAPEFWKSFVIDLSEAVDELKKELGNPSKWEDLTVGGTPDNLEKVIISKHRSPYVNCSLQLDVAAGAIQGTYKIAQDRPGTWPLREVPVWIDLRVDNDDRVYGIFKDTRYPRFKDLAAVLLELILTEDQSAQSA